MPETIIFTGNSIAVKKIVTIRPPETGNLDDSEIKIGLGSRLLTFTGFDAEEIVAAWNSSDDRILADVTAEVDGDNVKLTHDTSNEDFVVTVIVDDSIELVSSRMQLLFSVGITGGTYTVSFDGQGPTGAITYVPGTMATTCSNLITALNALSNVAPGDVTATSPAARTVELDWSDGVYAGKSIPLITVNGAGLLGGTATIGVVTAQQGSAGANEVQTIEFDAVSSDILTDEIQTITRTNTPTNASIIYTFDGEDTGALDHDHTATDLQTELLALSGLDTLDDPVAGDILATLGPLPATISVKFTQNYSGINIPQLTYTSTGTNSIQVITLNGATGGTFDISFKGIVAINVAYNVSAATFQTTLRALSSIGSPNLNVSGIAGGPWTLEFVSALAEDAQPLFQLDPTNLTGVDTGTVTETTKGVAGKNEIQMIYLQSFSGGSNETFTITKSGTVSGGTFKFTIGGSHSNSLAYDANAGDIALEFSDFYFKYGAVAYGPYSVFANVLQNIPTNSPVTFLFIGDLAGMDVDITGISITSALTGGGSYAIATATPGSFSAGFDFPSGNINLTFAFVTKSVALSATAATVQAALNTIPALTGNILVHDISNRSHAAGVPAAAYGLWAFEFIRDLAGTNVAQITTDYFGTTHNAPILTLRVGAAGTNEIQTLTMTGAPTGTFTLTYKGESTASLSCSVSTGALQSALRGLSTVGATGVTVAGGALPGTPATITFVNENRYQDAPLLVFFGEDIGYKVEETQVGSPPAILNIQTAVQGGTQTVFNTVGDMYSLKIKRATDAANVYWLVMNIPYDVTAGELEVLINDVLGAGSVDCTGGPHPDTIITITFTGPFANVNMDPIIAFPVYSPVVIRDGRVPERTDNTFELTIIPDEGTLGMNYADDPMKNSFFLNFTTNEASETNSTVVVRFTGLTPERIEDAINEHFCRKIVSVTRIVRSQEWAPVRVLQGTYEATNKKYYVWYYRGVYRLTFINEFADPETIVSLILTLPTKDDGVTPIDPFDFMTADADWVDAPPPDGFTGTVVDPIANDLKYESNRITFNFRTAAAIGAPIHLFDLTRFSDSTPNELTWHYSIRTQYTKENLVNTLGCVSVADLPPDLKIKWQWGYFTWDKLGEQYEKKIFTALAETDPLDWDASPEQHRSVLESMLRLEDGYQSDFIGSGNVHVEGSLYNSWLPDPYGLQSTAVVTDDPDRDFNNLRVTLTGVLARQPMTDISYELRPLLMNPFEWMNSDQNVTDYRFRKPLMETTVYQKPIQPLVNERQRFDITDSLTSSDTVYIGYDGLFITVLGSATIAAVQELLITTVPTLGSYSLKIRRSVKIDGQEVETAAKVVLPTKLARAITMYGTTIAGDPFEVEFTGFGLQSSDVQNLILMGGNARALIITTVQGSVEQPEIQTLTMTAGVFSGDFDITIGSESTADIDVIPYNATATQIRNFVRALASIGSGGVPGFTGGPINVAPVVLTFNQALNNVAQMVPTTRLNNGTVAASELQAGGTDGSISIEETVQGRGPAFWNVAENWDLGRVPSSTDIIVFDDATKPVKFGINQTTTFTVVDTAGKLLHATRRQIYQDGQKVWVATTGTLPTGFAPGYYFVVNSESDGTFSLSATLGGSAIVAVGNGVGTHSAHLKDCQLQVYSRYAGEQLGLPKRRGNGEEEYLDQYLKQWWKSVEIGILPEDGDSLSLLRVDTMLAETQFLFHKTQASSVDGIPSVLLLVNNGDDATDADGVNIVVDDGDIGLSVYSDESSQCHNITINGSGSVIINNCTATGFIKKKVDAEFRATGNTTTGGIVNI